MGFAQQRLRASRAARRVAIFMAIVGLLGLAVSVALAVWGFNVLSDPKVFPPGPASTASKIELTAVVGVGPALISLLVIAAGIYLQIKSIDLMTGGSDRILGPDNDEHLAEAELPAASVDLVGSEMGENQNSDDEERPSEAELVRRLKAEVDQLR